MYIYVRVHMQLLRIGFDIKYSIGSDITSFVRWLHACHTEDVTSRCEWALYVLSSIPTATSSKSHLK